MDSGKSKTWRSTMSEIDVIKLQEEDDDDADEDIEDDDDGDEGGDEDGDEEE